MSLLGIHFVTPIWLLAALTMPVIYLISAWTMKRRKALLERFSRQVLWERIIPELDWKLARRRFLHWCLAGFFFFIALSRPQWGEREETLKTTGLDVMILLDVSRSMEVEDVVPSRLLKSRKFLRNLLERLQGDRAGLVVYAGSAHLQSPLTTDLNYIRELVEEASPRSVTNQGTDIGAALEVAVRALDRGAEQIKRENEATPTTRVILLVSDGEDHEKQIDDGVGQVKNADLKLYVLGVGTERGGPIPLRNEQGQNFGFKRDRSGETVMSKANLVALQRLAEQAEGRYWTVSDSELELDQVMAELDSLSRGEFDEKKIAIKEERFQIFVAIGLLFFVIEMFSDLRRRRDVRKEVAAAFLFTLLSLGIPTAHAETAPSLEVYRKNQEAVRAFEENRIPEAKQAFGKAQVEAPDSPELSYNQGVVQLREGRLDEALQGLERAQRQANEKGDFELSARALYNAGIAHTLKKEPEKAAAAYLRALEANAKSPDPHLEKRIRKNLELLSQQQNQNSSSDENQDQKDDQKDQDQKDQSDQNQSGKNQNSQGQDEKDQKDKKDSGKDEKDSKNESDQQKQNQRQRKKREFKSEKLSPEDAERVMSELGRRERELKERLERQQGRPQALEKDW